MAYLTTAQKVIGILGRNYDGQADLTPHIATADNVVRKAMARASANGEEITAATGALMAMWMAGYFYTLQDPMFTSKSTLSASGSTTTTQDAYRKAAIELDDTGWLGAVLDKNIVGIAWLGKTAGEAIPFRDRIGFSFERG